MGIVIPDIDAATEAQQNHERLVEGALTIIVTERQYQGVSPSPEKNTTRLFKTGCSDAAADRATEAPCADEKDRFAEFQFLPGKNRVYDLQTVQMIQPGRFTVLSTLIDNGDLMTFELKVLDTLRAYCKRSDGKYPPPPDLFALGQPDLPIANIEIESKTYQVNQSKRQSKTASWSYPYKRFAIEDRGKFSPERGFLVCKDGHRDEWELFRKQRKQVTDGERNKELFDCKRGLWGYLASEDADPALIDLDIIKPHTFGDLLYHDICLKVTHETPYQSE